MLVYSNKSSVLPLPDTGAIYKKNKSGIERLSLMTDLIRSYADLEIKKWWFPIAKIQVL